MTAIAEPTIVTETVTPAVLPFGRAKGSPTKRILQVTSVDLSGNVVQIAYRCADCGETRPSFRSVMGHRQAHSTKPRKQRAIKGEAANPAVASILDIVAEVDGLRRKVEKLESKVKKERDGRLKAEGQIRSIERLFGKVAR